MSSNVFKFPVRAVAQLVAFLSLAGLLSVSVGLAGHSDAHALHLQRPYTGGPAVFVHVATTTNIVGHWTDIDNPATNNSPNAILEVTPNWAPHSVYDNHAFGVWYDQYAGKWAIFNQDFAAMPVNAAFNVQVLPSLPLVFVHHATAENTVGHYTYIDSSSTNNNPDAILEVTPNWNPGGIGGVYENHHVGVWYNPYVGKWAIFNQDFAAMPVNAAFNVQVLSTSSSAFVQIANQYNSVFDWTDIENPATNMYPGAIVFITPNWNPGGTGGAYNDHATGVWYHEEKWAVFNQDLSAIHVNVAFNVFVPPPEQADLVPIRSCHIISGSNGEQQLVIRVENLGLTSTSLFTTQLEFDNTKQIQQIFVGALSFRDLTFDVSGGFHSDLSYKLTVDSANEIEEANEQNNSISVTCVG